jgi:hypothetical protein
MSKEKEYQQFVTKLKEDPLFYFKTILRIEEFGSGQLIPFRLNNVQKILHYKCENQLKRTGFVRRVVLKPRRSGLSTYCLSRYYRASTFAKQKRIAIVAHDDETNQTLFNMVRTMERNHPQALKPKVGYLGRRELHWEQLNTRFRLGTAGGSEIVGDQISYLHCSEVSRWGNNAKDYASALLKNVAIADNTEVIFESTARGVGGFFYTMFWGAYDAGGASGYEADFFPWYVFDAYTKEFSSKAQKEEFKESLGKDPRYGGEEELRLADEEITYDLGDEGIVTFKVTLENLFWRRQAIDINCQGRLEDFHQDYPTSAREAFLASGRMVFDRNLLERIRQRVDSQLEPQRYTLVVNRREDSGDMKYLMEPEQFGELEIFSEPVHGIEYRIGVDVSEGIEINERDTDYSVAVVLNALTAEQVAMLRTKTDPDLLAWKLTTLAQYYNGAMLVVERNNHGLVTLRALLDKHNYVNLFTEIKQDEKTTKRTKRVGFLTTMRSRPQLIDTLREMLRNEDLLIKSSKLVDELMTFVILSNGKEAANYGAHDDCVMALALASWGLAKHPHRALARSEPRPQARKSLFRHVTPDPATWSKPTKTPSLKQ